MDSQSLLKKLPIEIIAQVASHLPTRDLGSLRRSCSHVEASLFETFSREFFTKKQFMLTEESLQALIDISNHPRLSLCLRHVIIGLDNYENAHIPQIPQNSEITPELRFRIGLANQFTLISIGRDREMLTLAFKNLPNLETVGLRDYNRAGRARDNSEWTSYGATTVLEETGARLIGNSHMHGTDQQSRFASRVFSTILYALGQSGARPQSFEVLLRKQGSALRDYAFNIPSFFETSVKHVLSNLKTLLLAVDLSNQPLFNIAGPAFFNGVGNDDTDGTCHGYLLRQYLCHTPNLCHLRLNFQNTYSYNPEQFLRWLGRPAMQSGSINSSPGPPQSLKPIALSHLRRLDFGILRTSSPTLLTIINKFKPTLRELSFRRITLMLQNPSQPPETKVNMWAEFFARLPELDSISVGYLSQVSQTNIEDISFKRSTRQSGEMRTSPEYSTSDMEHFPDNIISHLVVNWQEATDDTDDSDDDTEDGINWDEAMDDSDDDSEDDSEDGDEDDDEDDDVPMSDVNLTATEIDQIEG